MTPQQRQMILNSPTAQRLSSPSSFDNSRSDTTALRARSAERRQALAPTPQAEPTEATRSKGRQRLSGIMKGLGEETLGTGRMLESSVRARNPAIIAPLYLAGRLAGRDAKALKPGGSFLEEGKSKLEEKLGKEEGSLFKGETPIERRAKFGTQVATALVPTTGGKGSLAKQAGSLSKRGVRKASERLAKRKGREVLELSAEELKKINKTKLKFLGKEALGTAGKEGGIIKGKRYKMTKEVRKLQNEFKHLFKSSSADKNYEVAQKEGLNLDKSSDNIVGKYNKMMNEKVLRNKLQKVLNQDLTTSYASEFEKRDIAKKSIDSLINKIKTGDLKGLNKARKIWRSESKKASGTLSDAKEVLHKSIQEIIEGELPEVLRKIYKSNRTKMAKLFDVREILRAKGEATLGSSILKKALKTAGIAGAGIATYRGIKNRR